MPFDVSPLFQPTDNQSARARDRIVRGLPSLTLNGRVGNAMDNDDEDMTGIQEQLAGLGYLPERHAQTPDRYITKPIDDAIRGFQRDNNLKTDGWAGPGGETERAINKRVSEAVFKPQDSKPDKTVEAILNPQRTMSLPPPTINKAQDRIEAILEDRPAVFEVHDNPKASAKSPWYEDVERARNAVKKHDPIIEDMAKKHDVDPDMVRAVMWSENARGTWGPLGEIGDTLGISRTKQPMNINPKIWGDLLTSDQKDLLEPSANIEASAILLKRIRQRIQNPTVDKIGAVWHATAREHTDDYSEYLEKVYKEKPWLEK